MPSINYHWNTSITKKASVKILQINLQKAKVPTANLAKIAKDLLPDIIIAQEPNVKENKIEGLPGYWKSWLSKNQKAAIITLPSCTSPVFLLSDNNIVAIKIVVDSKPLTIISSYSSPYCDIEENLTETFSLISSLQGEDYLIGADVNAHHKHWGYENEDNRGDRMENFLSSINAFLLNTPGAPPTFNQRDTKGWPDITFVSSTDLAQNTNWQVLEDIVSCSDHKFISICLNKEQHILQYNRFKTKYGGHLKLKRIITSQADEINRRILQTTTSEELDETTIYLQQKINNACRATYKFKKTPVTPTIVWWNQQLEIQKQEIKALNRRIQKTTDQEKISYCIRRNLKLSTFKKNILSAKRNSFKRNCSLPHPTYGTPFKIAFKNASPPTEIFTQLNDTQKGSPTEIAQKILQEIYPLTIESQALPTHLQENSTEPYFINKELKEIFRYLPTNKAPGNDGIDYIILKQVFSACPSILRNFYNKCLELQKFPSALKEGIIVLFHKKGKEEKCISSYRPITLLPTLGQVLEKLLLQRINYKLENDNSLHPLQFGFRQRKSVDLALSTLLSKIKDSKSKKQHTLLLSIDIKGAFDGLLHSSIKSSLDKITTPSNITETLKDVLNNRKVIISTQIGPTSWNQTRGCPTKEGVQNLAKDAIQVFSNWINQNKLNISLEKTKYIYFGKLINPPRIKWLNSRISKVRNLRYLGIYIDENLSWAHHIQEKGVQALTQYHQLRRIAGPNWGINGKTRKLIYKTVTERMLCHGAIIWADNLTEKIKRKLSSIQRKFLLSITGAYHTTSTASLQIITGIPPLYLTAHKEAKYFKLTKLQEIIMVSNQQINPSTYEPILKGHQIHPAKFNIDSQITTKVIQNYPVRNSIYTDGSKTEEGTGSAFCHFDQTATISKEWQGKLHPDNNIFQAELLAIKQAIISLQNNPNSISIWSDSLSSIQALQNPSSPHPLVKEIQNLLHSNNSIHIGWIKAHVGHIGNETADALAKSAITNGTFISLLKPLSHLKKLLNQELLTIWKKDWDKTNQGKPIHELIPLPSFRNHNWDRREIMYFSEHGPFTTYLKRFNLRTSEDCSCGDLGSPLHFATSCPHTKNWHFKKPSQNNILHWKKAILNNSQSRKRLKNLMTFLMENDILINGPSYNS
ncbi:Putative protein in type-1 retrotransposable element R1DM [Araneus ventricosus]|uniref:RNase H type-1 domain-containing protein n=1 Tax=Araneus ventricosus TaxID=182803 RepID=A0A4Y2UGT0_ARAVE|nr:Putative protein in type-1 retrotransposable element R1DM [Araneus ventricosus]